MIKVATTTVSILLLCGAASSLKGQPAGAAAAQAAGEEAVRRQADKLQLQKTLVAAKKAHDQGELSTSARLYEDALVLVQRIGVGIDAERRETISGMVTVRMELAQRARTRGDLVEAEKQLSRALIVDPTNAELKELKKKVDQAIDQQKGQVPSQAIQERVAEVKADRISVSTLVQDSRLLIEMGKLNEAELKLKEAVKRDPEHQGAFYYLKYIQEAKFLQEARKREIVSRDKLLEVEQAWHGPIMRDRLPTPNPFGRTNLVHTSKGRMRINHKLDTIMLDEVLYDDIPLSEVVKDLADEARKRDPDRVGINFIVNSQIDIPAAPITFGAPDPVTGQPTAPPPPPEPVDLNSVIVRINPPLRDVRLADVVDAVSKAANRPLKFSVEDYAVVFTQRANESPQLYSRRFKVDPNTFLEGLESVAPQFLGVGGGGGGGGGIGGGGGAGGGGGGGGFGGGGGGAGGGGGSFAFPRVDLTGASSFGGGGLGGGAGGGLGGGGGGLGGGGGGLGGGGGGLGGGGGGLGGGGIGIRGVTYLSPMQSVQDLVRAFFAAAGIDFPTTNQLGGGALGGGGGIPGGGFDPTGGLGGQGGPRRALFYNDKAGVILARATLEELDLMEQAIQALNVAPPQVTIEARFVEISQSDSKGLGFDWFLGNFTMNGGAVGMQGGTAPSFTGAPSRSNPLGSFPGVPPGADPGNPAGTTIPTSATDQNFTRGLGNVVGADRRELPAVATITGILTDPQFRVVIRAMEQRGGLDVLSAPKVTTISGRQAKIDLTELRTIVVQQGFGAQASGGGGVGGVGGVAGLGGQGGGAVAAASQFSTAQVPLGPSLDIIPYVSADGYSVQMTIIPTLVEFLGYDDPGPFLPQAQSAAGNTLGTPLTAVLPLPRFRLRQVVTSADVWDGQTVVLGGLIAEDVSKSRDKIPVLGDIPLIGRFFRSESMATTKKNLVIFVTPTIIDPAGNRVHTDDNLPYDPSVPPVPLPAAPDVAPPSANP